MELFGRDHGKGLPQIEPRLRPEDTDGPRSRAIGARLTVLEDVFQQPVIFLHGAGK
jgi:hypothetical protein